MYFIILWNFPQSWSELGPLGWEKNLRKTKNSCMHDFHFLLFVLFTILLTFCYCTFLFFYKSTGHTESWQGGLADILSDCPLRKIGPFARENRPGPINPTKEITFIKLKMLFQEINKLFPERYVHLGGDECSYFCWWVYF